MAFKFKRKSESTNQNKYFKLAKNCVFSKNKTLDSFTGIDTQDKQAYNNVILNIEHLGTF